MGVDLEFNLLSADGARVAFDELGIAEDEAALQCVNGVKTGWMRRRDNERCRIGVNWLIESIGNVESCQHQ